MDELATVNGTDDRMCADSIASTPPSDIGSTADWVAPKPKPKPVPSWKWSLARSNASPVIFSDHEEFDWRSFSCRSSTSGIDGLPLEIFGMIVDYLKLYDLKSLRLVNKAHLLRLTPQVFRHVTVHLHPTSFQGLHCIATHSHLRHLVRSLTYDIRMVTEFKTEGAWQSIKERLVDPAYNTDGATFADYEEYYAAQMLAARADRQNLEQAFRNLPQLSSLELSTGPTVMGADWVYPKFTEFDVEKFGSLLPRLGTVPCALGSRKHQDRFLSLMLASSVLGDRFTSLTLDKLDWTAERLLTNLSRKLDKREPLKCLRHLTLGLNVVVGRKIYQTYYMYSTGRRPYCLNSVGELDSFELRLHYTQRQSVWGPFEAAIVPYSELGRDHIWQTYIEKYFSRGPTLKKLALTNVATTPAQVRAALEGIKGLERLELENIRLTEGSWFEVFEEMARKWKLRITSISLRGEFSSFRECWQADANSMNLDCPTSRNEPSQALMDGASNLPAESTSLSQPHVPSITVPQVSTDLYEELLALPEAERVVRWIKCYFEVSPADLVTQDTAWQAYQNHFSENSTMLAADFITLSAAVFSVAQAQVVRGTQPQLVVNGTRPNGVTVKSQPSEALVLRLQRWIVGRGLGMSPLTTMNVAKCLGESTSVKTLWNQLGSDSRLITAFVADSDDREAAGDSTFTFSAEKSPISENDSWRRRS